MNEFDLVWAAADRASRLIGLRQKARDLQVQVRGYSSECGACSKWITNDCPRERHVNGRRQGPSARTPICSEFEIGALNAKSKATAESELNEVMRQISEYSP